MSGAQWLVACDLDQTLIYSRRAFRLADGEPEPEVRVVEYLDGEPLSHMTVRQLEALRHLAGAVPVVPVTTRTLAQYARVDLGFVPAYAVAGNGGHLLVDGVADPDWADAVAGRLAARGAPVEQVRERAYALAAEAEAAGRPWARTIRDADGLFVYLVATERPAIPDLDAVTAELAEWGWTVSVQGRKVYFVPAALTKEEALGEVMRRSGAVRLAAAGDSLLDAGMLALAELAVRPAHGELHEQGVRLPAMQVTDRAGLLGGEELVDRLVRQVLGVPVR